jgi:hypothetical protein
MTTQHRMKKAFELFCAAMRAGATPTELVAAIPDAPTVATSRPLRIAESGDVPPPPDLNSAIRAMVHGIVDEPENCNTGEVPDAPSLNAAIRAFVKGIRR